MASPCNQHCANRIGTLSFRTGGLSRRLRETRPKGRSTKSGSRVLWTDGGSKPLPTSQGVWGSAVSSSSKKKCGFGALEASKMKLSEYFTIRWPFSVYGIVLKFSAFHGLLESTDPTPSLNDGP